MDTTAQIQVFFFKAMVEGWAFGGQKIKIAQMPGYEGISFRDGDFSLLDCWCASPNSPKSAGTTTIWHKGDPVWVMHYGGPYEENAIRFLMRALRNSYEAHEFVGGRGPRGYVDSSLLYGSLVYINTPRLNDFTKFEGREEVFDARTGASWGFHEYWGMSLI